jgi:hypothetical protein
MICFFNSRTVRRLFMAVFLGGIIGWLAPVRGETYYVAPGGDNENSGSSNLPWATPGFASKQLAAGDTLIIRGGHYILTNYYDDIVWTTTNGASNAWIAIRGEDGHRPVLQGINNLSHAVNISDKQFLRIENLALCSLIDQPYSGGMRSGINGLGDYGPSNIIIRDVEIYHVSESGIDFDGNISNVVVDSARIHHAGYTCISGDYNTPGAPGWQNMLITNCLLEYLHGNPQFRHGEWGPNGDFHLLAVSPAINVGSTNAPQRLGRHPPAPRPKTDPGGL